MSKQEIYTCNICHREKPPEELNMGRIKIEGVYGDGTKVKLFVPNTKEDTEYYSHEYRGIRRYFSFNQYVFWIPKLKKKEHVCLDCQREMTWRVTFVEDCND